MANTTNFNWETPDDTDLVKDGAAAIRTLGSAIDTSLVDLKGGTTGQILAKATNTDMDFSWITNDVGDITEVVASTPLTGGGTSGSVTVGIQDGTTAQKGAVQLENSTSSTSTTTAAVPASVKSAYDLANAAIPKSLVDAAGDLIYATANDTVARLGIGTAGQFLKVNSGATAPEWAAVSTGAFTRITGGALSGSATTFSNVFSSTYDAYEIVLSDLVGSTSLALFLTLGSTATGYYGGFVGIANDGTVSGYGLNNATSINRGIFATANGGGAIIYLINPNKAQRTFWNVQGRDTNTAAGSDNAIGTGFIDNTTAYTAFTLTTSTGTCTGTANIYGYTLS